MLRWCLLLLLCLFAHAQPINNACASPIDITSLPYTYTGTTVGATKDVSCSPQTSGDVWFTFTAPFSASLTISTCSSQAPVFDTILYLMTGSCGNLQCVVSNDDACGSLSSIAALVTAGTKYYIGLGGFLSYSGTYTLTVASIPLGCSFATAISSLPFTSSGTLTSTYTGTPCRTPHYGTWYSYVSPTSTSVTISTCTAASFDTFLYLASGSCPNLSCVTFDDEFCAPKSQITASLTANTQYWIIVTSWLPDTTGTFTLTVQASPARNDICTAATPITSLPANIFSSNAGTSADFSCSNGLDTVTSNKPDVWYSFTPTANYPDFVISTCYSTTGQRLYLASGSCGSRQCIQSDSSSCPLSSSIVTGYLRPTLQAGTTYFISVAAINTGNTFQLDLFVPVSNDQCAGATQISSLPYSTSGNTIFSRPDFICSGNVRATTRDVFYVFTPSISYSTVVISLCGSSYDTYLYFGTGTCASTSCTAWNDDSCGNQSVLNIPSLTAGTTYFIVVAGFSGIRAGRFVLSITGNPIISCISPLVINSIPYSYTSTTTNTGPAAALSCNNGGTGITSATGSFWFSFTPSSTINNVFIGTCSSSFNSVVFLATGSSCSAVQCSLGSATADYCSPQRGSLIAGATLSAGVRYWIVVTGISSGEFGSFTLNINVDSSASLSISSPAASSVGGSQLGSLTISGTAGSFDARGTVTLTISDSSFATSDLVVSAVVNFGGSWSVPANVLGLEDGQIIIDGRLVDPSGNVATARVSFTKDSTTSVFITVPEPGSSANAVSASSLLVQGTGEVGGSVFVTFVDGSTSTPDVVSSTVTVAPDGTWSLSASIAGLLDGSIRLVASITDPNGNTLDSPTVTINKDTAATVSILTPSNFQFVISQSRARSLTISGFADAGTTVFVTVSDSFGKSVNSKTVYVSPVGTWSVVVDVSSLQDGNISFTGTVTDAANNVVRSQTITLKKDTQISPATVISTPVNGTSLSRAQATSLVISGTTEASASISLVITGSSGTITRRITAAQTATGSWTATVNISSLPAGSVRIGGTTTDASLNGPVDIDPILVNLLAQ